MTTSFRVGAANYTIEGTVGSLPSDYATVVERAVLHDDFGVTGSEGTVLAISVGSAANWPILIVSLRFEPGPDAGFIPGVFMVPERDILFIGAGTRLLAYDLRNVRRLWEDVAHTGFWGWKRHGDMIIMSAELELAAWDLSGAKKWSTFVEPPWDYAVRDGRLNLDVMGRKSSFDLVAGPSRGGYR